ncbi:stage III sporulation protein AF [Geomicrobium sp. JSM 1781026]|uniref:stage III sporulation protein AF n=1 Tax=Geomicrobium sp. JSM 1781026 TaxID=3344580 RepID=UPI0035BEDA22
MEYFNDWITTLVVFLLLAIILELLLPTSTMKRYADLVLGLMMTVLILQPVFDFIHTDPSEWFDLDNFNVREGADEMENKINDQKREIQATHDAYISEQVAARLGSEAEQMLKEEFQLSFSGISVDENSHSESGGINVLLVEAGDEQTNTTVEPVREVVVNTTESRQQSDHPVSLDAVRVRLAQVWQVEESSIHIRMEEEDANG